MTGNTGSFIHRWDPNRQWAVFTGIRVVFPLLPAIVCSAFPLAWAWELRGPGAYPIPGLHWALNVSHLLSSSESPGTATVGIVPFAGNVTMTQLSPKVSL